MTRTPKKAAAEAKYVLLVAVRPEERDAIESGVAAGESRAALLSVEEPGEAAGVVRVGAVAAVVCSFAACGRLRDYLPELFRQEILVPTLVLVPPGAEERAAALYSREGTDLLLQAGNYRPLLVAWLARALTRREPSWEEVGRIVRHEINNPLTGVLGNAELLLADPASLPPRARARLRTIVDLAVRMRDVVQTLEVRLQRQDTFFARAPAPEAAQLLVPFHLFGPSRDWEIDPAKAGERYSKISRK